MSWLGLFPGYLCMVTLVCAGGADFSRQEYTRSEEEGTSNDRLSHTRVDVLAELQINPSLIHQLIQRVEILEAKDLAQQHVIAALEKKQKEQSELISTMRKKALENCNKEGNHGVDVTERRPLINEMNDFNMDKVAQLNDILLRKEQNVSKLNAHPVEQRGETGKSRRAEEEGMTAFTVGLTHDITNMGENQNIVFDHVETNIGNGYNSHHGVFTAPVAGTYVFHTSILAYYDLEIWCRIVVNGMNKADVFARGTDNRHDQGSQLIIVKLNKGDDVAVQNRQAGDAVHSDGSIWTTFSGFLLQENSQSNVVIG